MSMPEVINHPNIMRLIEEYGTPLMVTDLSILRDNIDRFHNIFPDIAPYYSTKTNSDPAVIDVIQQQNLGFDAATIGEINFLISRGADPKRIIYTHPIKTRQEILEAVTLGIEVLTLDSLKELEKLAEFAPGKKFFLRIRPIGNASLYDYDNKHGADPQEVKEILEYATAHSLDICGLSFHVGSQSMSVQPWHDVLDYCLGIITAYYEKLPGLRAINLGSGFPEIYSFDPKATPSLESIAEVIYAQKQNFPEDIKFIAEPGRILVASASKLFTNVVERIDRADRKWLFADMSAYNGLIEIIESSGKLSYKITGSGDGDTTEFIVAGKTLDPDDILGRQVLLPESTNADSKLVIHDVGAYSISFFSNYHKLKPVTLAYVDSTYDTNVLVNASGLASHGVVAQRNFEAGEKIFTVTGYKTLDRTRTSFQIDKNQHLEPSILGAYLNHSCDPNAGMRTNEDGLLDVVAKRPIAAGDEVVADYAMFEYELSDMAAVTCNCQSELCRRHIVGYVGLSDQQRQEYLAFTAAHLLS
jgi:ornithine decarboxylase